MLLAVRERYAPPLRMLRREPPKRYSAMRSRQPDGVAYAMMLMVATCCGCRSAVIEMPRRRTGYAGAAAVARLSPLMSDDAACRGSAALCCASRGCLCCRVAAAATPLPPCCARCIRRYAAPVTSPQRRCRCRCAHISLRRSRALLATVWYFAERRCCRRHAPCCRAAVLLDDYLCQLPHYDARRRLAGGYDMMLCRLRCYAPCAMRLPLPACCFAVADALRRRALQQRCQYDDKSCRWWARSYAADIWCCRAQMLAWCRAMSAPPLRARRVQRCSVAAAAMLMRHGAPKKAMLSQRALRQRAWWCSDTCRAWCTRRSALRLPLCGMLLRHAASVLLLWCACCQMPRAAEALQDARRGWQQREPCAMLRARRRAVTPLQQATPLWFYFTPRRCRTLPPASADAAMMLTLRSARCARAACYDGAQRDYWARAAAILPCRAPPPAPPFMLICWWCARAMAHAACRSDAARHARAPRARVRADAAMMPPRAPRDAAATRRDKRAIWRARAYAPCALRARYACCAPLRMPPRRCVVTRAVADARRCRQRAACAFMIARVCRAMMLIERSCAAPMLHADVFAPDDDESACAACERLLKEYARAVDDFFFLRLRLLLFTLITPPLRFFFLLLMPRCWCFRHAPLPFIATMPQRLRCYSACVTSLRYFRYAERSRYSRYSSVASPPSLPQRCRYGAVQRHAAMMSAPLMAMRAIVTEFDLRVARASAPSLRYVRCGVRSCWWQHLRQRVVCRRQA